MVLLPEESPTPGRSCPARREELSCVELTASCSFSYFFKLQYNQEVLNHNSSGVGLQCHWKMKFYSSNQSAEARVHHSFCVWR